eukprot:scaffold681_cov173-Ochromonas_danica.AAC.33
MVTYRPIKSIRTDTTLDLSHEAEKSDYDDAFFCIAMPAHHNTATVPYQVNLIRYCCMRIWVESVRLTDFSDAKSV